MPVTRRSTAQSSENATSVLTAWIAAFLRDKPLSRLDRVIAWQRWAAAQLARGMSPGDARTHIAEAWRQHAFLNGLDEHPSVNEELARAQREVFEMANTGLPPRACARAYRLLASRFPDAQPMLEAFADHWDTLDDAWRIPAPVAAA